jgi:hypothetical protein
LVDDLLLTPLDLVRLSRFQVGWNKIMGYPSPSQKNFSAVLYESQELSWRQVGFNSPAASPLYTALF